MNESQTKQVGQLHLAFKALLKSVEKMFYSGGFEGTGDMVVKQYTSLHTRLAEFMSDDYYVTQVLRLDIAPDATEKQKVAAVNMATAQIVDYLDGMMKSQRGAKVEADFDVDFGSLGRDIQDQVLRLTRNTIRRAVSNIDINVQGDMPRPPRPPSPPPAPEPPPSWQPPQPSPPPQPPTGARGVPGADFDPFEARNTPDIPFVPPVPPIPPTPSVDREDDETV